MKPRHGYTLVEMVLVIGSVSVVLGLCVGVTRSLMVLDRAGRTRLNEAETLGRLARQFRQDVRAATKAHVTANGAGSKERLTLMMRNGATVDYQAEPGRLLRVEAHPTDTKRHETYRLPLRASAQFDVRKDGAQSWVSLMLRRKDEAASLVPRHDVQVECLLGRDRRLAVARSSDAQ